MGKRSEFERVERDFYPTPVEAVIPLQPHLPETFSFCEPCAGNGQLTNFLEFGISHRVCTAQYDLEPRRSDIILKDALTLTEEDLKGADYIITNPPWDRKILHPMIQLFASLRPTWLLFDADWMHTKQSIPYMDYCEKIVSIGRIKWFPGSKMTGKDNCAWYLFDSTRKKQLTRPDEYYHNETKFYGRR